MAIRMHPRIAERAKEPRSVLLGRFDEDLQIFREPRLSVEREGVGANQKKLGIRRA